jgi:mannose-6-phosphate isomerase
MFHCGKGFHLLIYMNKTALYPMGFGPILKQMIWGGNRILSYKGLVLNMSNIGESWELSGVPGNESVVSNGEFAGRTITELIKEYGPELLGRHVYETYGEKFPLLIKFIDARDDLSIQVHPDDAMAQAVHGQPFGKTEMWYVVSADKDAHLMSGLSAEITPEEYVSRVENNTITDVLCDYKVASGDVFFLPAGRIHSIGKGCFIAEIQQTSDLTYRIYDFGRLGLDGKPRELHTELAKDAIDYSVSEDYRTAYTPVLNEDAPLVECEYFKTNLLDLTEPLSVDVKSKDSFMIVICLEGLGKLKDSEGNVVALKQGETVLVPAVTDEITFIPQSQLKVLTSWI